MPATQRSTRKSTSVLPLPLQQAEPHLSCCRGYALPRKRNMNHRLSCELKETYWVPITGVHCCPRWQQPITNRAHRRTKRIFKATL